MTYLKNFWYCAAWSDEVSRTPLPRTILGEKLVLFRKLDGQIAALGGICPHRFAPLHAATLQGDVLTCRYHGLQFGTDGRCVHNPHGDTIPPALRIPAYTLVERSGAAWIWMGDPEAADENRIPELTGHGSAGFRVVHGLVPVKGGFELVADNLLDLSHTQYLHGSLHFEEDDQTRLHFEVLQQGDTVITVDNVLNVRKFAFSEFVWPDCPARVDWYTGIRWQPPANMLLKVHFTPVGVPESEGIHSWGAELVTPETETSCHYFWSSARDYRLDDDAFDEALRDAASGVFNREDAWMIGLIQEHMGQETDLLRLNPVILPTDKAAVRARLIVRRLMREEEEQQATKGAC